MTLKQQSLVVTLAAALLAISGNAFAGGGGGGHGGGTHGPIPSGPNKVSAGTPNTIHGPIPGGPNKVGPVSVTKGRCPGCGRGGGSTSGRPPTGTGRGRPGT